MVAVPGGVFEMGDDNHEADERPLHKVDVPSFYIDKCEVTNSQYKQFCDQTKRAYPANPAFDSTYFQSKPDYPVIGVTFEDALAYASWANKQLPTEEQWEKAASWDAVAQRKKQYTWGDQYTSDRANIATGHLVKSDEANGDVSPYGALNMAGNALEWVNAPYKAYAGNSAGGPYNPDDRVIRGGTFVAASKSDEARGSYRNHAPRVFPQGKSLPVGIRCVVPANDPKIQSLLRDK
jgi:iron(II)-dependent oxidoreductase